MSDAKTKMNCTTWLNYNKTEVCGHVSTDLNEYDMGLITLAIGTSVRRVKLRMEYNRGDWYTYMHVFPRDRSSVGGSFGDITLRNKGVALKPTKRTNPLVRQVCELCVGVDEQLQQLRMLLTTRLEAEKAGLEVKSA